MSSLSLAATEACAATGAVAPKNDYAELRRRVAARGLLKKRPGAYVVRLTAIFLALVTGLAVVALAEAFWVRLLGTVFLAPVFVQLAFMQHDSIHQQIFRDGRKNGALSLVLDNLLLGISVSWWRNDHSLHHTYSNQIGKDPNLEIPSFAFTDEQAASKTGVLRWTTQHQAKLMFLFFALEGFAAHFHSVRHLLSGRVQGGRWKEAGLLVAHAVLYLGVFLWQGVLEGLALVLIHQLLTGFYLSSVFAPNHKGMPVVDASMKLDFLRLQVLTSRNVRPHPLTDFLYGGLNYQIEHHLFPTMPRPNLRAAREVVRAFCMERGLAYHETSIVGSYREILGAFSDVSARMAPATPA